MNGGLRWWLGDCAEHYGPPRRLVPCNEDHVRGQLIAAGSLGFPSASPSESRPTRPTGAEKRSLTKDVQSSLYTIFTSVLFHLQWDIFRNSLPQESHLRPRDCSVFVFISKQQQANQIGLARRRCVMHQTLS